VTISPAGDPPASWTDVQVPGDSERAEQICEAVTEQEMRIAPDTGLRAAVARACASTPLPRVERAPGEVLLVDRHVLSDLDVMLLVPEGSSSAEPGEEVIVTHHSAYESSGECERMRAELIERQRAASVEAARAAREWLESQLATQREATASACAEADQAEERCEAIADQEERGLCANQAELTRHRCDNARSIEGVLETRLDAQPAEPEAPPPPECRPASSD
jgi:hypothetical protein